MAKTANTKPEQSAFEKKLVEQTAATAIQLAWGAIGNVATWTKRKLDVQKAMRQYAETYRERYGEVKVRRMAKPMPLHEIYTAVRVVPPDYLSAIFDPEKVETEFGQERRHDQGEKHDGVSIANQEQFLDIPGAPGSGKSTFLRRLGQEAMLVHSRLPVLLEWRRFRDGNFDLIERITDDFAVCGFPENRQFVEAALKDGRLLILLDGLDEVPDDRLEGVVTAVGDFVDRYGRSDDGNRFVTSSGVSSQTDANCLSSRRVRRETPPTGRRKA